MSEINWWSDPKRYRIHSTTPIRSGFHLSDIGREFRKVPYYTECRILLDDPELEFRLGYMLYSEEDDYLCDNIHENIVFDDDYINHVINKMNQSKRKKSE